MRDESKIRLFKFYPRKTALLNLRTQNLKISRLDELNDPFEFDSFEIPRPADRTTWSSVTKQLWATKGIICFSETWKNPLLWAHYADSHQGLCLGFDVAKSLVAKISYVSRKAKLPPLERLVSGQDYATVEKALTTKYLDWQYEKEWRMFLGLDEQNLSALVPLEPFSEKIALKEVYIGIRCEVDHSDLRPIVGPSVRIIQTKKAIRSFSICAKNKI